MSVLILDIGTYANRAITRSRDAIHSKQAGKIDAEAPVESFLDAGDLILE